ncbi:MAG: hypothetical protein QW275_02215 [Candidatus Anstonellaceae archaeon]
MMTRNCHHAFGKLILFSFLFINIAHAAISQEIVALCKNLFQTNICGESENSSFEDESAFLPYAAQTENISFSYSEQHRKATGLLEKANSTINKLKEMKVPHLSAYDQYLLALQWFKGQEAIEMVGGKADYEFVEKKVKEIEAIEKSALRANDELNALEQRIAHADPDANLSQAIEIQNEAKREFEDERFSNVISLAERAHQKIAEAEIEAVRSRTLVDVARRNLEDFIRENWQKIVLLAFGVSMLLFLFRRQIRIINIKMKINALKTEKAVLENMIKTTQKNYFDGKINEMSYKIKSRKFSDMIRDINRKIPLLEEELKKQSL